MQVLIKIELRSSYAFINESLFGLSANNLMTTINDLTFVPVPLVDIRPVPAQETRELMCGHIIKGVLRKCTSFTILMYTQS